MLKVLIAPQLWYAYLSLDFQRELFLLMKVASGPYDGNYAHHSFWAYVFRDWTDVPTSLKASCVTNVDEQTKKERKLCNFMTSCRTSHLFRAKFQYWWKEGGEIWYFSKVQNILFWRAIGPSLSGRNIYIYIYIYICIYIFRSQLISVTNGVFTASEASSRRAYDRK